MPRLSFVDTGPVDLPRPLADTAVETGGEAIAARTFDESLPLLVDALQPRQPFPIVKMDMPEPPETACQPQRVRSPALRSQTPGQRLCQIGMLRLQQIQPLRLFSRGMLGIGRFDHVQVEAEVARPRLFRFTLMLQLLRRILTERLEHLESALRLALFHGHHRCFP